MNLNWVRQANSNFNFYVLVQFIASRTVWYDFGLLTLSLSFALTLSRSLSLGGVCVFSPSVAIVVLLSLANWCGCEYFQRFLGSF